MKKILTDKVFINTGILLLYTYIMEVIVRCFNKSSFLDFGMIRILMGSFIIALLVSWIGHFFNGIVQKVINITYIVLVGILIFVEFGLYNYLGFFMGVGNAEQGGKVTDYVIYKRLYVSI